MATIYHDTFPPETKLRHVAIEWTGARVHDLGCNSGALGAYVLARGAASYAGWEVNAEWAAEGRRRYPHLTIHTADVREADLDCDILCCLGLFHHLPHLIIERIVQETTAHTIVTEQPMGLGPFQNYQMRPETWYRDQLERSGFTNIERAAYGFSYPVDRAFLIGRR